MRISVSKVVAVAAAATLMLPSATSTAATTSTPDTTDPPTTSTPNTADPATTSTPDTTDPPTTSTTAAKKSAFTQEAVPPQGTAFFSVSKTGTEPFDSDTWDGSNLDLAGLDENDTNDVVRLRDLVEYRNEINNSDADASYIIATYTTTGNSSWPVLPSTCSPTEATVVGADGAETSVISEIFDVDATGDQRGLRCVFPNVAEGQSMILRPAAVVNAFDSTSGRPVVNDDVVTVEGVVEWFGENNTYVSEVALNPISTTITGGFAVNLTARQVGTYSPAVFYSPDGLPGRLVTTELSLDYLRNSMLIDSDEDTYLIDYSLRSFLTDGSPYNDTATVSSNARLADWVGSSCEVVDGNPELAVSCSPGTAFDYLGSVANSDGSPQPDGLADPSINIELTGLDVRDPELQNNLAKISLRWWIPDTDFFADPACDTSTCTLGLNIEHAEAADPSGGQPVSLMSTELSDGSQIGNYNGSGEPLGDTLVSIVAGSSSSGSWVAGVTHELGQWGATSPMLDKTAENPVQKGDEFVTSLAINFSADYEEYVSEKCIKFDPTQYELVGPSTSDDLDAARERANSLYPGQPITGAYREATHPLVYTIRLSSGSRHDVSDASVGGMTVLYSDDSFNTLDEMRDTTCDDIQWTTDPSTLGAVSAIKLDMSVPKADLLAAVDADTPDFRSFVGVAHFTLRVADTATGYGPLSYMPTYSAARRLNWNTQSYNSWRGAPPAASFGSTDPDSADFSYEFYYADRMRLVESDAEIFKRTEPAGIKAVTQGEVVTFQLDQRFTGVWSGETGQATVVDELPEHTSLVENSLMVSADAGATWVPLADYQASGAAPELTVTTEGQTITFDQTGILPSQDELLFRYDAEVAEDAPSIAFTNTVTLTSPLSADLDNDGSPDPKTAAYTIDIQAAEGVQIVKTLTAAAQQVEDEIVFKLRYRNLGVADYTSGQFIDILPFNGDSVVPSGGTTTRTPASDFHGTYAVTRLEGANQEVFYGTATDPTTINMDVCAGSNLPAGYVPATTDDPCGEYYYSSGNTFADGEPAGTATTVWEECTSTDPVTCGSIPADQITAVKFKTGPILATDPERSVTIAIEGTNNLEGDVYTNNFGGRIPGFSQTVVSNDVSTTLKAGWIGDFVWFDRNRDGVQDEGEEGIAGVPLRLEVLNADGEFVPYLHNGEPVSTVTDADGFYKFANLRDGRYRVVVDNSTVLAGVDQTFDPDDTLDHMAEATLVFDGVDVTNDDTRDFGYDVFPGAIGDFVWFDKNGDGVQDEGEPGLPGIEVRIDWIGTDGEPASSKTVTDDAGWYGFTDLPLTDYAVVVNDETLPADVVPTYDFDGDVIGVSATTLTAEKPVDLDQDFGYKLTGKIQLIKRVVEVEDTNGDGLDNAGDMVHYSFEVINTGLLNLIDVTITDEKLGLEDAPCVSRLDVGQSAVCRTTVGYTITDADVEAGGVENVAITEAIAEDTGEKVTDLSDTGTDPERNEVDSPCETETDNPIGDNPNDPDDPCDDPTTVKLSPKPPSGSTSMPSPPTTPSSTPNTQTGAGGSNLAATGSNPVTILLVGIAVIGLAGVGIFLTRRRRQTV